ncbi:MAG: AMP-binding protein [Acidobacteriaceae bacterium]|nr:AMP-binding protein [Acidobacteriaceae bacterium]
MPVGGFGMAIAGFMLAFAVHGLPAACVCLSVLGFMGGLFVVPLNAILQHNPAADEKGRVLATANFVNTIGIMAASGVVWVLHEALHFSAPAVFAVAALLTAGAAAFALRLVPQFAVRLVLFVLTRTFYRIRVVGAEQIPQRGPALLVANHVTYVDGFLIAACMRHLVRFLVDEVWFDRFRPLFRLFDAIRVPAGNRRAVVRAIEIAREELTKGHVVCIFAEGALTQTGNLGEFHRGLERIVSGLSVPVIPVHIGGAWGSIFSKDKTASIWRSFSKLRWPITVSFGNALVEPAASDVRQAVVELGADAAMAATNNETLGRRFVECAKRNWSRCAVTELSGRTLTYGETLIASELLASKINALSPGQKMIGVMLPACSAGALANLAIVLSGRAVVNLNFTSGAAAIDSAVDQCELKVIMTSQAFLEKAKVERRREMVFVEDLVQFGRGAKIRAFLKARLLPTRFLQPSKVNSNDVAAVLFSSGSTGAPKGVMLSHRNLIANTESVAQLFPMNAADAITGVLPLFHAFGFTYTLWFPLLNGATAAYHPQPLDAKGVGELVWRTKATILPAPPTFCMAYLRGCSKEQLASLRFVLVGAERLNPKLAASFEEKFGVPMLEGYGATEMSPVIAVNVPDREHAGVKQTGLRPGTVGQTIPGVAARVVNRETGERCRTGEEGLLLVKGANRMLGYLNRPEETAKVLRGDWYVTGDIVTMDDEGFIKIVAGSRGSARLAARWSRMERWKKH